MPLPNPRHERFCQEYVFDFNGARSYRAAGYKIKADNDSTTASAAACRLLKDVKVKARVMYLLSCQKEAFECNQATVKQRMIDVLNADVADYCVTDETGRLVAKPLHLMEKRELLQEISSEADGKIKLRFISKDRVIEHLAKIEKLLVDSHEISGELMVRQQLEANEAYKKRLAVQKTREKVRYAHGG